MLMIIIINRKNIANSNHKGSDVETGPVRAAFRRT